MTLYKKVGIVGCGTIGSGIAAFLALHRLKVIVISRTLKSQAQAQSRISARLLANAQLRTFADDRGGSALESIVFSTELDDLREADLVIESIAEDLDAKRQLFTKLEAIVSKDCVLATDTSSFTPRSIFEGVANKQRCVGMHFFNPADMIPLVELAGCGEAQADPRILESLRVWLDQMGKSPIVLEGEVPPGYIANRLQAVVIAEACRLIEQNGVRPEDIDKAMTTCLGLRWAISGPLQSADLGGLDIFGKLMAEVNGETPKTIQALVDDGRCGAKSGEGFYVWQSDLQHVVRRRDHWLVEVLASTIRSL